MGPNLALKEWSGGEKNRGMPDHSVLGRGRKTPREGQGQERGGFQLLEGGRLPEESST
jgi:hypothetical protein